MNSEIVVTDANVLSPSFGGSMPKGAKQLRNVIQTAMNAWLAKSESQRTKQAMQVHSNFDPVQLKADGKPIDIDEDGGVEN